MPAGKVVAKETSCRNFAALIDIKVGGLFGDWEGYVGSMRGAELVEQRRVEGSDVFAEMLIRRQNSFALTVQFLKRVLEYRISQMATCYFGSAYSVAELRCFNLIHPE